MESKEAKGYVVDLGLKDGAKGFIKMAEGDLLIGGLVSVLVKSASNKVIRCDLLTE